MNLRESIKRIVMGTTVGEAFHSIMFRYFLRRRLPKDHVAKGSYILTPSWMSKGGTNKIFMEEGCQINNENVLYVSGGNLVMKKNSGASVGLTVVTDNHQRLKGMFVNESQHYYNIEKDIVIEEDVWLAVNVTLLCGAHIGRGATVGAGAVVFKKVPPYAIVMGNPAKVVGFNFTPEEIIEHEKALYPPEERLPLELLQANYKKYFTSRRKEIREFVNL